MVVVVRVVGVVTMVMRMRVMMMMIVVVVGGATVARIVLAIVVDHDGVESNILAPVGLQIEWSLEAVHRLRVDFSIANPYPNCATTTVMPKEPRQWLPMQFLHRSHHRGW